MEHIKGHELIYTHPPALDWISSPGEFSPRSKVFRISLSLNFDVIYEKTTETYSFNSTIYRQVHCLLTPARDSKLSLEVTCRSFVPKVGHRSSFI